MASSFLTIANRKAQTVPNTSEIPEPKILIFGTKKKAEKTSVLRIQTHSLRADALIQFILLFYHNIIMQQ